MNDAGLSERTIPVAAAASPPPASGTGTPSSATYPRPAVAWLSVGVLFLLYWLSMVDRLIMSFLIGPIRRDLGISDFEISLLQGAAFGACYALCGLPLGWLVDRLNRRRLIFWGVMAWSLATTCCGLARNFGQLFLSRVGVGAGEATLNPASYSILADSFPPHRLTMALTVYAMAGVVGGGMAFLLGGLVVEAVTAAAAVALPVVGSVRPWQLAFLVIGAPGALLALLAFAFPEPQRQRRGRPPHRFGGLEALRQMFRQLSGQWRFYTCHHTAFTLMIAASTGLTLWSPAYLARSFGWRPAEIGLALGLTMMIAGLIGGPLGGWLIDRRFARGVHDAHFRWFLLASICHVPLGLVAFAAGDARVFLAMLFCMQVFGATIMGVAAASLQIVTPGELRGRVSAFYLFVNVLLGIGLGPSVVGAFTDFLFHDDAMLGWSLALTICIFCSLAAIVFRLGCRPMRDAVAATGITPLSRATPAN